MHVKRGQTTEHMVQNDICNFSSIIRKLSYGFQKRVTESVNVLISTLISSVFFHDCKTSRKWFDILYIQNH